MDSSLALHYPTEDTPAPGALRAVAPGVAWVRMPLPFALDHINLWVLQDGDGLTLVDSGIALDSTRRHWNEVLAAAAQPVARLIVTHFHPDHLGLGEWLAQEHGLRLWMTQGEFQTAHAVANQLPGYSVASMLQQFQRHGLDPERMQALADRGNAYRRGVPALPVAFRRIFDGEEMVIGGRAWRVIVGYGHAPEHASLHCAELGVLISGDMVLPRISTNISVFAATPEADPLGWYLDSLERLRALPEDTLVLPSHGLPFRGLHARIGQLQQHHEARCAELLAACTEPRTACELLGTLFPRRLDTHQVMFAMGEAIAHLNYLEQQSKLRRIEGDDGVVRFIASH